MKNNLVRLIDNRWFPLADLLIVLGSGVIWYIRPEFGWKILLIALLPWVIRMLAGRSPFRLTPFDIPILIFLVTALLGARVAYDQNGSWAKFWIILTAVLLFYSLAGQPRQNTWIIVGGLSALGVLISIVFLLVFDWQIHPVRLEFVNQIGKAWMAVRPSIPFSFIKDDDIVSNILLVLSPFPILLLVHGISQRHTNPWPLAAGLISLFLFGLGLVMAATLQVVVFGCMGLLIVFWWGLSIWLERKGVKNFRKAFYLLSGLGLLLVILVLIRFPDGVLTFVRGISRLSIFENRFAVIDNTLHLTKDFLFTGGGLGSFPGLYSRYIMGIPYLLISFGSNLFLQVAIENGVIGSIAYLGIIVGGMLILLHLLYKRDREANDASLIFFSMLGYSTLLVVGMFDAILYHGLSILLIFIIPGFAVFTLLQPKRKDFSYFFPSSILIASIFLFLSSFGNKLSANYYANLGSLKMAQLDLLGWTVEEKIQPLSADKYGEAIKYFEKAIVIDGENPTANYRMGMLAVTKEDFTSGAQYLNQAFLADPNHRGIMKDLGYSLVWMGELDQAKPYLIAIPEAIYELEIYSWWWGTQNRNDLSDYARHMENILITSQTKGNN